MRDAAGVVAVEAIGFEDFWAEYPVKEGKLRAQRAWENLNPNLELRLKIIASVQEQKKRNLKWKDGFITTPANFIADGRWMDDLGPIKLNTPPTIVRPKMERKEKTPDLSRLAPDEKAKHVKGFRMAVRAIPREFRANIAKALGITDYTDAPAIPLEQLLEDAPW